MPIGKSSITKRVAKVTTPTEEKNIAPELVATVGVAPAPKTKEKPAEQKKAAPKTTTTKTTAKTVTSAKAAPKAQTKATASKTTAKTATSAKAEKPATKAEKPAVETTVLSNVAPETVEAVIGHKEDAKYEKVQIGGKMPTFLL